MSYQTKNKDNHYKILANGNRIYVRIGARIDGKVNYSVILEVTGSW